MRIKIVSDSSCNVTEFAGVDYASVPLKICTQEREYVDDAHLDVARMVEELKRHSGKSGSSCPNVQEWLEAFGDADWVFAITITSNLSGSCNAAMQAAREYMQRHEGAKVCVLDTLSTGGEMQLIMERLRQRIQEGLGFEEIEADVRAYMGHTHLIFALQSLTNLARNGRVSPAVAAIAGVLGIWVVGKASDQGTLEQMHKSRGEKRALRQILQSMIDMGYAGGKVRLDHCLNPEAAQQLKEMIQQRFPGSDVQIGACRGLCSFYAEKGGMILGFEDGN